MGAGEIFAITKMRRENIVAPFCQAGYEAWLEEEIERGDIPFPGGLAGFWEHKTAACRAAWRGSPKPQADDQKTATAHQIWRNMGVITDEVIASDIGLDIEDVYAQRAREKEMREQYNLPEAITPGAPPMPTPNSQGENAAAGNAKEAN
jgi:capsid protein